MYIVIIIHMLKCEAGHIFKFYGKSVESHLISDVVLHEPTEANTGLHVNTVVIPCLHPAPAVHGRLLLILNQISCLIIMYPHYLINSYSYLVYQCYGKVFMIIPAVILGQQKC